MKIIDTKNLKPGMIAAERIYTPKGQFLIEKGSILTAQMILHMQCYSVPSAKIDEDSFPSPGLDDFLKKQHPPQETHAQKIKKSSEFTVFKKVFHKNVTSLHLAINDFIIKNETLDTNQLLSETMELFSSHTDTISMFDMLHNQRQIDDSTYAHSINVSVLARMMGIWLEYPEEELNTLTLCGLLHDIGKSAIPNRIIEKPGKLTDEEYGEIKKHPRLGYELLDRLPIDERIKNAALMHHERCDGTGYPAQLTINAIDDFASIISIADVYDAMTADRCYRAGLCPFEVIALFEQEGLSKYKPDFIRIFLKKIADAYIHNDILLNDGRRGEIVLINQHLTRPVIQTGPHEFVDLEERLDLYVQAII